MEEIQQYYIEYDKEGKYTCQKYKVVDTIIFENEEFERFKSGFCQACDFLKEIKVRLYFSNEGEYLCLAITNDNSNDIIWVCSFQYPYLKFVVIVRRDSIEEKYIDIFARCGGLSLGLYNAGWKGVFVVKKMKRPSQY